MRQFLYFGASFLFLIVPFMSVAEEEVKSPSVGSDRAVIATSKEEGIKLSEKAKVKISIKTIKLAANFQIPVSALIRERAEFGVYIKKGEWFKYIEVEVENPSPANVRIESPKVHVGDEIVISGVSLLRLGELNLSNSGGDND